MRFPLEHVKPDQIETKFTFACHKCGEIIQQVLMGADIQGPNWPAEGWRRVMASVGPFEEDGVWICPKHSVVVLIDGEVAS